MDSVSGETEVDEVGERFGLRFCKRVLDLKLKGLVLRFFGLEDLLE